MINSVDRRDALAESKNRGFNAIMSGLGLPAGKYHLMTASGDAIFAIKEVQSNSTGNKFAITLVAGVVRGAEETNSSEEKVFGIGPMDAQLAVTADHWLHIKPNNKYEIEIVNGRVKTLKEHTMDNIVEASEVVTKKKKSVVKV